MKLVRGNLKEADSTKSESRRLFSTNISSFYSIRPPQASGWMGIRERGGRGEITVHSSSSIPGIGGKRDKGGDPLH